MNKLLKILYLIFFSVILTSNVFAEDKTIDYLFLNGDMDLLGSFHIKEALITTNDEISIPLIYKPYTKSGSNKSLEETKFYNARGIKVKCVNFYEANQKEINMKLLDKSCKGNKLKYKEEKNNSGIILNITGKKTNRYKVYLIDYFIDQAVVTHKDISEVNFPFINDLDYKINHAEIQILLSGYSEKFKFWSHSSGSGSLSPVGEVKKDKNYYKGIYLKLKDIDVKSKTTIRMLFDKSLTKTSEKILTNSNKKMYKKIIDLENQKTKETKRSKKIIKFKRIFIISSIIVYMIGLISLCYYFIASKFDLKIMIFYILLGIIILIIYIV